MPGLHVEKVMQDARRSQGIHGRVEWLVSGIPITARQLYNVNLQLKLELSKGKNDAKDDLALAGPGVFLPGCHGIC